MQLCRGLLVLPLIASLVVAPSAFAAHPTQGTVPAAASAAAKPVTFDLAEPRDFVAQTNFPRRRGTWAGAPIGSPTTSTLSAFSGKYVLVLPYAPRRIARDRHIAA